MHVLALLIPILPALIAALGVAFAPATIGAGFINLAGIFVAVMGMALDYTITVFVVQFEPQVYSSIAPRLAEVWTAFRDIANIVIIGMFTFIAISTIIGIESFGAKKLIARILIIAVLINFSLLFSRIIIASSNFVAGKLYVAMSLDTLTNSAVAGGETPSIRDYAGKAGVSGRFIQLLGLDDALHAYGTVEKIYAAQDDWLSSVVWTIAYSFTTATIIIVTGIVLFYAVFLLLSRTILLIFLLVISALAFAAHLIPKWGDQFWDMWWSSLIRNAVFAPLFMLMLWATLVISYALVAGPGTNRSFDKLFSEPTSGSGIMALLTFFIILGMLYGSIRFASAFATKITGFNWAAMIPALGFGVLTRTGGVLGRQFIGRPALNISERLQNKAATTDNIFARRLYDFGAQQFKGVAQKDFTARGEFGSMLAKTAGMKIDQLAGKKLGGFEATQKAFLKRVGEQAGRIQASDKQKEEGQKQAKAEEIRANPEVARDYAYAEKEAKERKDAYEAAEANFDKMLERHDERMKDLQKSLAEAVTSGNITKKTQLEKDIRTAEAEHAAEMRRESDRIKTAKILSDRAQRGLEAADKAATAAAKASGRMKWAFQQAGDTAEDIVNNSYTSLLYASGISKKSRERLAAKANKETTKDRERHHFKEEYGEAFKAMMKDDHSGKNDDHAKTEDKDH